MSPTSKHIRVFTDGAARGNPGPAGAAAVFFDQSGTCLGEVCEFLGEATNNVAEYRALILGLSKAKEWGARTVEVTTDSQLLARQWNGEYRVKNKNLRPLYEQARELGRSFERVEVRHVLRDENVRADDAANRAIDSRSGTCRLWR